MIQYVEGKWHKLMKNETLITISTVFVYETYIENLTRGIWS